MATPVVGRGIWVTQTRAYFLPRLPARSLSRPSPADILATLLFLLTNTLDFTSRRRPSDNSNFFRSFFLLLSLLNVDCDMRDKLKWGIRTGIPVLCPYGPPMQSGTSNPCGAIELSLICRVTPPGAVGRRSSTNSTS